jgi:hypothetical protein
MRKMRAVRATVQTLPAIFIIPLRFLFTFHVLPGILKTGLFFCSRQRYHYRHNRDSWHDEKHLCFTICNAYSFHGILLYQNIHEFARLHAPPPVSCFLALTILTHLPKEGYGHGFTPILKIRDNSCNSWAFF